MKNTPFIVDTETGCRAMVKAIEKERPEAYVPGWPWTPDRLPDAPPAAAHRRQDVSSRTGARSRCSRARLRRLMKTDFDNGPHRTVTTRKLAFPSEP